MTTKNVISLDNLQSKNLLNSDDSWRCVWQSRNEQIFKLEMTNITWKNFERFCKN